MQKDIRKLNNRRIRRVSSWNAALQHLEVVRRNRKKRTKFKEIAIEGVIPINLCLANHIPVLQIFFSDYDSLSDWAMGVIEKLPRAELFSVAAELMSAVSDKSDGSEIVILARQPEHDIGKNPLNRIVILDRPSSPGNFGSIVRTCESFSIDAVFVSGHGMDPYEPRSISASRGTVFSLPIVKLGSNSELEALLARCKEDPEFVVYGSSAKSGVDLRTVRRAHRFALIVGNETTGMTPYLKELADVMLQIPMRGMATSLNIACAASILVYELSGTLPS